MTPLLSPSPLLPLLVPMSPLLLHPLVSSSLITSHEIQHATKKTEPFSLCPPPSMYAFSAFDNQQLQYLWDWTHHNLTIKTGKLFFRANPKLCTSEIHKMWEKTGIQGHYDQSDFRNNGDRASCKCDLLLIFRTLSSLHLRAHRWGPHPGV